MTKPANIPCLLDPNAAKGATLVFGGGLAGLSAGYRLSKSGLKTIVLESDKQVGGLSKTLVSGEFRYDIGGHRFHTKKRPIEDLVVSLMGDELIEVNRKSKIFMREKFFDYPLRPSNAMFGLGPVTIARIMLDYAWQKASRPFDKSQIISLEDWVVRNFGRTMFNIYFKQYSEKVWGIDCQDISQKWVAKRIHGLSLWKALKNAFFKFTGSDIPTLTDRFLYPKLGIGRLSDRFKAEIEKDNSVYLNTRVISVKHGRGRINGAVVENQGKTCFMDACSYISTIPLNKLALMLDPLPPADVINAANSLRYRDLVLVAVKIGKKTVTDQSWIYVPEKKITFGRMHEPKIWSSDMAPEDKSMLVLEYFCTKGDPIWNTSDEALRRDAACGLEHLGFVKADEIIGSDVVRVSKAYPLFDVGYEDRCEVMYSYLKGFKNLSIAGRAGMFQYQNMDRAIESGSDAADEVISKRQSI